MKTIEDTEKAHVYLFTSPTCPHCPTAKNFIEEFKKERDDYVYHDLSTMTPEGQKKAQQLGIMSVPTFVIKGPGYPDHIGLQGTPSKDSMNKYIDMSLGKVTQEKEEPKKSLRERLKEGIKIGKIRIKI